MLDFTATPGRYRADLQQWLPLDEPAPVALAVPRLTVATFNVWFAADYFEQRCAAMLALFAREQPDIIVLEEVTPEFLAEILRTPWIQEGYRLSDIYGGSVDPYGVLILSRLPIQHWQIIALPSAMDRHLVTAQALLNGQTVTFAGVHLESRASSTPTRAKQLARIFAHLAAQPHVFLMGDFNFCSTWQENQALEPDYHDLWPLLRPDEPGFTEDTARNAMRLRHRGQAKQVRFDRILLRSKQPGWRATSIRLLGTEPIGATDEPVFPSDHFGLVCTCGWQ